MDNIKTADEIIKELKEHGDQLHMPGNLYARGGPKEDYVGLTFAMGGVLYFDGAHLPEVREAIASCFEMYEQYAKPHLNWLWREEPPEGRECTAYKKAKPMRTLITSAKLTPDHPLSFSYTSGKKRHDAGEWQFEVFGVQRWAANMPGSDLSVLTFTLPVRAAFESPLLLQTLFVEFARILKAQHGYAGYTLAMSLVRPDENQSMEATLVTEFNGIDAGGALSAVGSARSGFKIVSWLTAVNSSMLEEVGGISKLRSELPPDWFAFYNYGEGIVIQAGPEAQLGEVPETPKPAPYTLVNHALKSVRMPAVDHGFHYGSVLGEPRIGYAWANDWLKRFDIDDDELILVKSALLHEPKLTKETTLPDHL